MLLNWLNSLPGAAGLGMVWGIMAIGLYISYKILDFSDLTVDGSICTGAAITAVLVTNGVSLPLAMLISLIGGMVCGLATGLFHTLMGIPAILSGILTQLILWSVNLKIMSKSNIAIPGRTYDLLVTLGDPTSSILVLLIFILALVGILYWFFGTELGTSLRATGNNPNMSRAQGININFTKIFGLMLSNGVVALSGSLLAQYNGASDINMGRGAIVIGLAAIIIGEGLFSRLSKNFALRLVGVMLGGVIYYFVYQTVVFLGLDTDLLKMLSAIVVAIFLAVPYWRKNYFTKTQKHTEGKENA